MLGSWQDLTLAIVSFVFAVALLPTVLEPQHKPPIATSSSTAILLIVTGLVEITLSLWVAALACFLTALMWIVLFVQRVRADMEAS